MVVVARDLARCHARRENFENSFSSLRILQHFYCHKGFYNSTLLLMQCNSALCHLGGAVVFLPSARSPPPQIVLLFESPPTHMRTVHRVICV